MEYKSTGSNDTRSGFGEGLLELGRKKDNVVALCADLVGSLKMEAFEKEFPDRFFQCGIAEANMMGIAAGLTIGGKIPFTGSFANFSTGRVYDQIRQSIAYSGKNVKICNSTSSGKAFTSRLASKHCLLRSPSRSSPVRLIAFAILIVRSISRACQIGFV